MRASLIFSTNDVIANVGVLISGLLVAILGSRIPDLTIGAIVAAFVVSGGWRILNEARAERAKLCESAHNVSDKTDPTAINIAGQ